MGVSEDMPIKNHDGIVCKQNYNMQCKEQLNVELKIRSMKLDYQFLTKIFENLVWVGNYYSLFCKSTTNIPNLKIFSKKQWYTSTALALKYITSQYKTLINIRTF